MGEGGRRETRRVTGKRTGLAAGQLKSLAGVAAGWLKKKGGLKLTFAIHHKFNDVIYISGDTIQEIQKMAEREIKKRGWKEDDCWGEQID